MRGNVKTLTKKIYIKSIRHNLFTFLFSRFQLFPNKERTTVEASGSTKVRITLSFAEAKFHPALRMPAEASLPLPAVHPKGISSCATARTNILSRTQARNLRPRPATRATAQIRRGVFYPNFARAFRRHPAGHAER